jgi:uncharacterized protein (DUF433 family)
MCSASEEFIHDTAQYTCMSTIVEDEKIRSGDPRIEGTRITVLDIKRRVIEEEENPHVVAGEYDISMAELFTGLAYYYGHIEEMRKLEAEEARMREKMTRKTAEMIEAVEPEELADQ